MNCRQAQKRLADYTAGFTGPEQSRRLEAHLSQCEPCRERLAQFVKLDRLSASGQRIAADLLVRRVMARTEGMDLWRQWRRRFLFESIAQGLLLACALVAALTIARPWIATWIDLASSWKINWALQAQSLPAATLVLAVGVAAGLLAWVSYVLAEE